MTQTNKDEIKKKWKTKFADWFISGKEIQHIDGSNMIQQAIDEAYNLGRKENEEKVKFLNNTMNNIVHKWRKENNQLRTALGLYKKIAKEANDINVKMKPVKSTPCTIKIKEADNGKTS